MALISITVKESLHLDMSINIGGYRDVDHFMTVRDCEKERNDPHYLENALFSRFHRLLMQFLCSQARS